MNDNSYVEVLVARKASVPMLILKYLLIILSAFSFLLALGNIYLIIALVVFGVGAYFATLNSSVEYEYQYCEKEITVDKILNKSKRKNVAVFETDKIEAFAPSKSYHLDEYRNNRNYRTLDFSTGVEKQPDATYTMFYDGREKVVFEPSTELIDAVKNVAPRKVFTE